MILFLDDDTTRITQFLAHCKEDVIVVRTAHAAIRVLESMPNNISVAFLDHDLGDEAYVPEDEENTGSEVVRYITRMGSMIERFVCHSMNVPARKHMVADLKAAGHEVWDAAWNMWDWSMLSSAWKDLE